jgi:hypothetical protein
MLPVPVEKESLKVFLRVKPKTDHDLMVFRLVPVCYKCFWVTWV